MAHPDQFHLDELHDMRCEEIRSIWEGADEADDKTAGPRMLVTVAAIAFAASAFGLASYDAATRPDRPAACAALTADECVAFHQEISR